MLTFVNLSRLAQNVAEEVRAQRVTHDPAVSRAISRLKLLATSAGYHDDDSAVR